MLNSNNKLLVKVGYLLNKSEGVYVGVTDNIFRKVTLISNREILKNANGFVLAIPVKGMGFRVATLEKNEVDSIVIDPWSDPL